jgi:hypothetical protein
MATTPQSLESLRRQLEGRWECIERARERYATLTRRLTSVQWMRALRDEPELLTRAREQEAELTEVLAYMEHRARVEQWPPDHPGLGVLHELRTRRAKLEALARKRLAGPLSPQGNSFLELLEQLEALALAPVARLPEPDEPVLLEGWLPAWPGPGHFWLTPERLVWRPWFGEPVQTPLESLAAERSLPSFGQATALKSLLALCRQLPHGRHEQPPVRDLVTLAMYWHPQDYPSDMRWGLGVFGSSGLAFLPASPPPLLQRLKRFLGIGVHRPGPLELRRLEALGEYLRRLPSDAFNRALGELTRARGGKHYGPFVELIRLPDLGQDLRFLDSGRVLVVPASVRSESLHALLEDPPPSGKAPSRVWWRHYKEKLGIALGMALSYPLTFMLPPGLSWVAYLMGHGISIWSSARYAKAKGYPWVLGLVLAMGCSPAGALLLFFLPERKKPEPSKRFESFMRG